MNDKENRLRNVELLSSVDFFAQNLSIEQIASYGYRFIHDLLGLESSGIFVLRGDHFVLETSMNADFKRNSFSIDGRMKQLATRFGRAMQRELTQYFDSDFIEDNGIVFAMPIIVKDETLALIFSKVFTLDIEADVSFIHGINQLINKAAESAVNFRELQKAQAILDRKVYNLLFINHSTRALMRELNLKKLYQLCVDVISELTASSVTSFGLYDAKKHRIVLKGYKDIISYKDFYCEMQMHDPMNTPSKTIYHIEDDRDLLETIFSNYEVFETLKAEYVVLLFKEEIIGCVTIGQKVNGQSYGEELLNQVESMAASIYIAITNAVYVKTIDQNRQDIEKQLAMMKHLNDVIRTISGCESLEEMAHLILQTMQYGFLMDHVMIIMGEPGSYKVVDAVGMDQSGPIEVTEDFARLCRDQVYFEGMSCDLKRFIKTDLDIEASNCFVSIPLFTENEVVYGYIISVKSKEILSKAQVVAMETLANSIAPLIKQLERQAYMESNYVIDQGQAFISALNLAINNREAFYTDFRVYFKRLEIKPFKVPDLKTYDHLKTYRIENVLLHIDYESLENEQLFDGWLVVEDAETFIEELQMMV